MSVLKIILGPPLGLLFKIWSNIALHLRTFLWGLVFKDMGEKCLVYGRITVSVPEKVSLGEWVTINEGVVIYSQGGVTIGNYVRISPHVTITTVALEMKGNTKDRPHYKKPIIIREGAWIGTGAVILPGIEIGKNSVVAANSVVNKNVPDNVVVAGLPARVVRYSAARYNRQ